MKLKGAVFYHIIMVCALLLPVFSGCASKKDSIRIGSKNFTEQFILGEIMAQLLEAKTNLEVERKFNLGGTMICHGTLTKGEIDIYPEYTGTGLTAILKKDVIFDPDEAYKVVSEEYPQEFSAKWLKPFGFNNTYAITVRKAEAEINSWKSISDLAAEVESLKAGFTAEFMERPDGYPGLSKAYGLSFDSVRDMDPGLMYQAIAQKEVDVICAFLTDARIPAYELLPLNDDKGFFPPYYAAPVIRTFILEAHPELEEILNLLAGKLDDDTMRGLNYKVDEKGREPGDVAKDFLIKIGLLQE